MSKDQSASRNSEASIEVHWKASAEFRFWLHDPEGDGMCYFRTAADRDAYAKKAIDGYCDDTWAEEVEGVVGGEVTHVATRVNEKQRPPDDEIDEDGIDGDGMYWGDSEIQSQCGFELAPLAPVSERGTPINQCDGCQRGLPVVNGKHDLTGTAGSYPGEVMACTKDRYVDHKFIEAIRVGCNAAEVHLTCSYPACSCKQIPAAIRAVLSERNSGT